MGKGAPHVVVLSAPCFYQLLELGNNLLPAAIACVVHPVAVMDFLAAVKAQHHVAHLMVGKIDHVIVDQHAVCGQCKAEMLVMRFLDLTGIRHQLLHHIEVHQRLAAEEIHLQIVPGAGIFDQEVQRPLAHLIAHQRPVAVVLALTGKAVGAIEVAGVGNVQAQCLDHACRFGFQITGHRLEGIFGKQLARRLQLGDLVIAFAYLLRRHALGGTVLFCQLTDDHIAAFGLEHGDDIIGQLVHRMDRAGADIQHDVVAVQFVLMDHILKFPSDGLVTLKMPPERGGIIVSSTRLLGFLVFAGLIGNTAAGLAGRLAGSLALAAAALLGALAKVTSLDGIDVLHDECPPM